jgi:hypothetical protein
MPAFPVQQNEIKIGLLLTAYNCEKYLDACLKPWIELKEDYNIVISASSCMFNDYRILGIPYRNEKTLEILLNHEIDFLITTKGKNLLKEDQLRNMCLNFLKLQQCDLIWVIDGDEIYSKNEIINIIDFIYKNPTPDWYYINFKNSTIHDNLFITYKHMRISWNNRYGGLSYFYFDNKFIYENGTSDVGKMELEIPKNVAYVSHKAWISDDIRSRDKIKYQNLRYSGFNNEVPIECRCGYYWDETNNRLDFNKENYKYYKAQIPTLHEELSKYSTDFTIEFSRNKNKFDITSVHRNIESEFEIYDSNTNILLFSTHLDMKKDVNYFIQLTGDLFDTKENFHSFLIKVYEYNILIHAELLHLKLKEG